MAKEIDQSGKIEQTEKKTVLCLANDEWDAVVIPGRVKRQLQEVFRRHGQTRNFIIFTFCAGLAILLKRNKHIRQVIIDREYAGKESIIMKILLEMVGEKKLPSITFRQIGKEALAHKWAHDIATGELKAKKIVTDQELLKEIKKTEVGKRLKDA